jgi:DNA polymerase-3 subunit epsilon
MFKYIDFTVFDLETTGLDPDLGHKIVEIGAIRLEQGGTERTLQTLVNPLRPIPQSATAIHQITDDMVKSAPPISEILPGFLDFCRDSVIVAHNARFDLKFLSYAMNEQSIPPLRNIILDSIKLARRFYPNLDSYALPALRRAFNLDHSEEHRALSDVRATLNIFKMCLTNAQAEGINDIEKLQESQGGPISFPLPTVQSKPILSYKLIRYLLKAMDSGDSVKIMYQDPHGAHAERMVTPRRFVKFGFHVYMIAYCSLEQVNGTFRMDRVQFANQNPR